jgi:HK97 gp10 family phage protein
MSNVELGGFSSNSPEIIRELDSCVEPALTKACMIIESQAKSLTPVETGALRDSMSHEVRVKDGEAVGVVGSPLKYAVYVEFGTGEFAENGAGRKGGWTYSTPDGGFHKTKGMRPRKMIRTAFKTKKADIVRVLEKELGGVFS